jgi:hypothetical protein
MREYIWMAWPDWHYMFIRWHLHEYIPGKSVLEYKKSATLCHREFIPPGGIVNSRAMETHPSIKLVCKKCQQLVDRGQTWTQ